MCSMSDRKFERDVTPVDPQWALAQRALNQALN
ncbi:hypothetical protein ENSA5_59630 [Enhygromyxa salina]|uniref:Uncharacterized protein n=1 Tax=Enhygromyxa salina TaxID=215803 RepID=A0A2S9XDE4_9BACT|nr:hypothetical protein ENSA5_59630 [Enhygromyxa salina]